MANLAIPSKVAMWTLAGKPGNVRSQNTYTNNSGYNLFCQENKKFLTYAKVPLGINLDYTTDAAVRKTHLVLPDRSERDIRCGELFAFGIGGGDAFLEYSHRTLGINLKWSDNPEFQWRMFSPGIAEGQPLPTGARVAISNDKVEPSADFLIYFDREPGMGDVGWTTSSTLWNQLLSAAERATIDLAKKKLMELVSG
jgi:hypothetical protein